MDRAVSSSNPLTIPRLWTDPWVCRSFSLCLNDLLDDLDRSHLQPHRSASPKLQRASLQRHDLAPERLVVPSTAGAHQRISLRNFPTDLSREPSSRVLEQKWEDASQQDQAGFDEVHVRLSE